ncbi:MAG: SIS domain-containing protein [Patescibacteria group bacterium]
MAITSDGNSQLEKIIMKDNVPGYVFRADKNPSGVPRLGLGYSVFGMAVMLAKSGLFTIDVKEIEQIITDLELWDHELRPQIKIKNNAAKKLAEKLYNRQIIVVGAEFLQGNLRTLRNQICETGKTFAGYLALPELNHYAMEGLGNPKSNKKDLIFFFIDSSLYHPRVQKRSELTKEVIKKNGIKYAEFKLRGRSRLEQSFELLQFGSWVTFYLAMLNNENPAKNPWVDWFKARLK